MNELKAKRAAANQVGETGAIIQPLAMSILTAAKLAGISRSSIYREIAEHRLRSVKCGKRRLVTADSLRAWLDALPASTAA